MNGWKKQLAVILGVGALTAASACQQKPSAPRLVILYATCTVNKDFLSPYNPEVRYTPEEDDVRATIRLRPAARWVADYYPVEIETDDGSEMVVRFSASDPAVPARLLVRLGASAELVEGAEVARSAADLRSRILARYTR